MTDRAATEANRTFMGMVLSLISLSLPDFNAVFERYAADLRQKALEAYAQDEWKMRSNLTVYYGVRYSYFPSPYDKNGRLSTFVPELWDPAQAPQVTGAGNRVAGTGNWCNGVIVNSQNYTTGAAALNCRPIVSPHGKYVIGVSKKDFAPRFGLAWDPLGKGTTSIRTGYGIYHEQVLVGTFLQDIGLNPPYQETATTGVSRLDNPGGGVNVSLTVQGLRAVTCTQPHALRLKIATCGALNCPSEGRT
jgi:hypothetical protein